MKTQIALLVLVFASVFILGATLWVVGSDGRPQRPAVVPAPLLLPPPTRVSHRPSMALSPVLPGAVPRILLVGDSITQQSFGSGGWGAGLANWYMRRADVINRGFSGYNSRWLRHHLPKIAETVPQGGPFLFATLFLGANDSAGNHQHVPLDEFATNLKAIIAWLHGLGVSRVIVMAPPPMAPEKHIAARNLRPEQETRSDAAHAAYGAAAKAVAESTGSLFLDVRQAILDALGDNWKDAVWDGLHLSPQGNEITFKGLKALVEANYPDVVPVDAMAMLLPYHGEPALHALPPFPVE